MRMQQCVHLARECRLLALVLYAPPASFTTAVEGGEITAFVTHLVAFVLPVPLSQHDRGPPQWLATIRRSVHLDDWPSRILLLKCRRRRRESLCLRLNCAGIGFPRCAPEAALVHAATCARPSFVTNDNLNLISALRLLVLHTRAYSIVQDLARRDSVPLL